MSLRQLVGTLLARLRRALDRFRARRFLRLGLPRVGDELARDAVGALPALPESVRMPAYQPTDDGPDYQAPESPLRWLAGETAPVFRLASIRALPPPPPELAVLRLEAWRPATARLPFDRTPRIVASLGRARPELFGVEADHTRIERKGPLPLADTALLGEKAVIGSPTRLRPPDRLGRVEPAAFGLASDGTPPSELDPIAPRGVRRLARARASFLFRFTEQMSVERILSPVFASPTEGLEAKLEPFFDRPDAGAQGPVEASIDEAVGPALDEVREQFLLRRGIGRVEVDDSELGTLVPLDGLDRGSIKAFTGLTFESLQPEPVEPLKMRLANPPVDMAPAIEASTDAWAMLAHALADFSADPTSPPPVPELPDRFKR